MIVNLIRLVQVVVLTTCTKQDLFGWGHFAKLKADWEGGGDKNKKEVKNLLQAYRDRLTKSWNINLAEVMVRNSS